MNLAEVLEGIWNQILDIISLFVMPDWGGVIALLPILVVLGLVAPFMTFLALGTVMYLIRKPRTKVSFVEGSRVAEIGADGEPTFPVGLPYCRRDSLIYPSGTHYCDNCKDKLAVICPMCGLGRLALIDTCTNCGLVLKVKPKSMVVAKAPGPKAGGAAAA